MTSTLNPHFLSQMDSTPTLNLQDGTDFPHSGLFDMLHKGLKGDYAVKLTATDFDITQSSTGSVTRLATKGGSVMRNNQLVTIGGGSGSSTNLDLTTTAGAVTTNGTSLTSSRDVTPIEGGDCYLMIVAAANNTIQLRGECGTGFINKVPMILTNDIPIAMVKVAAGAASTDTATDRPIQYFTTDKTAESLTLAYSSGTYPSHVINYAGIINASASGNAWTTANQNITMMKDGGQIDLILTTGPDDSNVGPKLSLKNQKGGGSSAGNTIAGTIQFESIADDASAAPTASMTSKILGVAAGNEYGDLRFSVANQNGNLLETLSLVGSAVAADVRVGVNKAAPLSRFEVDGSFGATLLELTAGTTLDIAASFVAINSTGGGGSIQVNLPARSSALNRIYTIKNDGSDVAEIHRGGSDTIMKNVSQHSETQIDMQPGEFMIIAAGAAKWRVLAYQAMP